MAHRKVPSCVFLAPLLGLALLTACTTTSGKTLSNAVAIESGNPEPKQVTTPGVTENAQPPQAQKGLAIVTTPAGASVYLNGKYLGETPLVVDGIEAGSYRLEIRKGGYYDIATWISFPGDYMLFQTPLVRITGFLSLSVTPSQSIITLDGQRVFPGYLELPVGSYLLVARAFGFSEHSERVEILAGAVTTLDLGLEKAAFSVTQLSSLKKSFNPDNPGVLGTLEVTYGVTGPGTGKISVYGPQGDLVFEDTLPDFMTWQYAYTWNLRDSAGAELPDGTYRLVLSADGKDGAHAEKELIFAIDRGIRESARSVWSGASGLLYAPTTDILPDSSFQASLLGAATLDNVAGSAGMTLRAPFALSLRGGIADVVELSAEANMTLSSGSVPLGFSFAARYPILRAPSAFGFGASLEAKASIQYNPAAQGVLTTDTYSDFTGLSVDVPLQLTLGSASLLFAPGIIGSLWQPLDTSTPPALTPSAWLYLRGGILLDFGVVTAGVSAALRTMPLPGGALTPGLPFQVGAEVHWLVPGTHAIVSGVVLGEISDPTDYYFAAGGGLGFIY